MRDQAHTGREHNPDITQAETPAAVDRAAFQAELDTLLTGRQIGRMQLVCYLRQGDRVFETYWTTIRGVEAMDNIYALMDLTAYGRQETWEDSPAGWPQRWALTGGEQVRANGRPIAQWSRIEAGRSDDLGTTGA